MNSHSFIRRLFSSPFGWTFAAFLLFQVAFLLLATTEWPQVVKAWMFRQGVELGLAAFFIFCVHVLVGFNTVIFITQTLRPVTYLSKLSVEAGVSALETYQRSIALLVFSAFMSGAMALCILLCIVYAPRDEEWVLVREANELLSMLIFGVFLFADTRCVKACTSVLATKQLSDPDDKAMASFRDSVRKYVVACDAPGFCGLVLIYLFSAFLQPQLAGLYWKGFVAGAIGFHMAFSQSVLAFLDAEERRTP